MVCLSNSGYCQIVRGTITCCCIYNWISGERQEIGGETKVCQANDDYWYKTRKLINGSTLVDMLPNQKVSANYIACSNKIF